MPRTYTFHSDTNQALFEDALARTDLSYRRVRVFTVAVSEPPDWLEDLAVQLGADCAGG